MYVIVGNYGNDTIALIEWVKQQQLAPVFILSVETGFTDERWRQHREHAAQYAHAAGLTPIHLQPKLQFAELMTDRGSFPTPKFLWCAGILKGLPILEWLDAADPSCKATLMLGTRRSSARHLSTLHEFTDHSEEYGDRKVWHPLYCHDDTMRDALLQTAGFLPLPHRSLECQPCVNSTLAEWQQLTPETIAATAALENSLQTHLFVSPATDTSIAITDLAKWAKNQPPAKNLQRSFNMSCAIPFGCGI